MDWREIGIIPLTDAAGITKQFNAETHRGLDIGWYKNKYCPVLAWQDGTLIAKGYSGEVGYWCVLEHEYDNGTNKRWVGYIHLYQAVNAPIGSYYKMGQQVSNARRGNTGYSNGVHLHIYMTRIIPKDTVFKWTASDDPWVKYAIDPLSHLYHDKKYNTDYIAPSWSRPWPEEEDWEKLYKEEKAENEILKAKLEQIRKIVE